MGQKPTLQQVAEACGLSIATVDRVLNHRGGVNPEKERVVMEWARKLKLDRNLDRRPTRILRVAVVTQHPNNPFFERVRQGVLRANQVFSVHNIQLSLHYFDILTPEKTAALIRRMSGQADALLISVNEHPQVKEAVDAAASAIPVLSFVSDVSTSDRRAYVGPDNFKTGRVAGDLMGRFLGPEGGDIVIVAGSYQLMDHHARRNGFYELLKERYPTCRIIEEIQTQEKIESLATEVAVLLRDNPGIRGIYSVSAGNQGIAKALIMQSCEHDVTFIAHEITPERKALLQRGVIDVIIDQDPEGEILVAVELLAEQFGRWNGTARGPSTPFHLFFRESV